MDTSNGIRILAHEPDAGWLVYDVVDSRRLAELVEADALAEGFDDVMFA